MDGTLTSALATNTLYIMIKMAQRKTSAMQPTKAQL